MDTYTLTHLVEHLLNAGRYNDLFILMEDRKWHEAKRKFDPSARSLALDIDNAIQAAEYNHLLVRSAMYSMIYGYITSTAERLPVDALVALVFLGRAEEAMHYTLMISDPVVRRCAFCRLANAAWEKQQVNLATQAAHQALAIFLSSTSLVGKDLSWKDCVTDLDHLIPVILSIGSQYELSKVMLIIDSIKDVLWKASALSCLAAAQAKAGLISEASITAQVANKTLLETYVGAITAIDMAIEAARLATLTSTVEIHDPSSLTSRVIIDLLNRASDSATVIQTIYLIRGLVPTESRWHSSIEQRLSQLKGLNDEQVQVLLLLANLAIDQGDVDWARKLLQDIYKLPKQEINTIVVVQAKAALLYFRLGDKEEAEKALSKIEPIMKVWFSKDGVMSFEGLTGEKYRILEDGAMIARRWIDMGNLRQGELILQSLISLVSSQPCTLSEALAHLSIAKVAAQKGLIKRATAVANNILKVRTSVVNFNLKLQWQAVDSQTLLYQLLADVFVASEVPKQYFGKIDTELVDQSIRQKIATKAANELTKKGNINQARLIGKHAWNTRWIFILLGGPCGMLFGCISGLITGLLPVALIIGLVAAIVAVLAFDYLMSNDFAIFYPVHAAAYAGIAQALAENHQVDEAKAFTLKIKSNTTAVKDYALTNLVAYLVDSNRFQEAQDFCQQIERNNWKAEAKASIACALGRSGSKQNIQEAFHEAMLLMNDESQGEFPSRVVTAVLRYMILAENHELAVQKLASLRNDQKYQFLPEPVAIALAQKGQLALAESVATEFKLHKLVLARLVAEEAKYHYHSDCERGKLMFVKVLSMIEPERLLNSNLSNDVVPATGWSSLKEKAGIRRDAFADSWGHTTSLSDVLKIILETTQDLNTEVTVFLFQMLQYCRTHGGHEITCEFIATITNALSLLATQDQIHEGCRLLSRLELLFKPAEMVIWQEDISS